MIPEEERRLEGLLLEHGGSSSGEGGQSNSQTDREMNVGLV